MAKRTKIETVRVKPVGEDRSSNIRGLAYLPETNQLCVVFKGSVGYMYEDVDLSTYDELTQAESMGKYLNSNIKVYPENHAQAGGQREVTKMENTKFKGLVEDQA